MLKSLDVSFTMIQKLPDEIESATSRPNMIHVYETMNQRKKLHRAFSNIQAKS